VLAAQAQSLAHQFRLEVGEAACRLFVGRPRAQQPDKGADFLGEVAADPRQSRQILMLCSRPS